MAKDKVKKSKPAWNGVLQGNTPIMRIMASVVIAVSCISLAFTQLGFVGIGHTGEFDAYAVTMLVPVALEALFFGPLLGAGMGFLAGTILFVHARIMPLGFYELAYVTLFNSVIMLAISGWLFGVLFRHALRSDPPRSRRILRIILVCILVSWFYSLMFVLGSLGSMLGRMAADLNSGAVSTDPADSAGLARTYVFQFILRLGNIPLQAWVDAGVLAIVCLLADYAASRIGRRLGTVGLRAAFNAWLIVVVGLCFMVMEAATFFAITEGERTKAGSDMRLECLYLQNQLQYAGDREKALSELFDKMDFSYDKITDEEFDTLLKTVSNTGLLSGYTEDEDGIVIISSAIDNYIHMTNSPRFVLTDEQHRLDDFLTTSTRAAINRSLETGQTQSIIYNPGISEESSEQLMEESLLRTELGYLHAIQRGYYVVTIMRPASMVFAERQRVMTWTTASIFVLLAAVFALTSRLLNLLVAKRIDATNEVLERITQGDLEAHVESSETSEFDSLATGINTTVDTLKGWIAEAESRMDADLRAAKAIQESALPTTFPPFPDISSFDIYASMDPAREVGGDFYDFFLLEKDGGAAPKLGFLVADVSGKGIPASLFMMKAKTLIRDYLENGIELGEAIENANHQLCDGNDANMFVTAWIGILDYKTGHIDYVNAGHNPPLLWASDEEKPDPSIERYERSGAWQWLREKSGIPLGTFDAVPYKAKSLDVKPGDMLLLYTDGVTEAMSADGELYGEQRLEALADAASAFHPRMLVTAVKEGVADHARDAEQSDDITILALEYGIAPEMTATITVPATIGELHTVNDFIHSALDQRFCPLRVQNQIDIAVEELFVNVASYAYPDATEGEPGTARVSYSYSATPPSITIKLADDGIPFDPLAVPDEKIPAGADPMELRIGGLGILMAQKSVDEMLYDRVDDSNVVTLVKRW